MQCPTCNGKGEVPKADTMAIKCVIAELNRVAGTHYRPTTKQTVAVITARLKEGWTAEDFAQVIRTKCDEWLGDPAMRPFIRPTTIFGPKFEGYLNQSARPPKQKVKFVY